MVQNVTVAIMNTRDFRHAKLQRFNKFTLRYTLERCGGIGPNWRYCPCAGNDTKSGGGNAAAMSLEACFAVSIPKISSSSIATRRFQR